jgi:hypothetical protein
MNYKILLTFTLISLIFVTGCTSGIKLATPSQDEVATQVSILLTQVPTATSEPSPILTFTTTPSKTEALKPSETPAATVTLAPTPTALPSASPTVAPTMVPPTATMPPTDPKLSLGKPTWRDTLETGKNFGLMDSDETKVEAVNGYLVLTAKNANGFRGWTMSYPKVKDFYLEATFKTGNCSGKDHYGLVFRATAEYDAGYFLGITCDGHYNFTTWDKNGSTDITAYTKSTTILSGSNQINRLGVKAKGGNFYFFINGKPAGEATDQTFKDAGPFGMFIGSQKTINFTVEVDEIAYWKIEN